MGFKCGIVGLPNVGKSTLFNALTKAGVAAENFPFCTVEPNSGVIAVPDPRLDRVVSLVNPARVVPASMEFVDIAGLVKGASKGDGLGTGSWQTSGKRMPSPTWCAVSRMKTYRTYQQE